MVLMQKTAASPHPVRAPLILAACLLFLAASPCGAASQREGAALYRKHCSVCHREASKLARSGDLVESLRNPPVGMPAYSEDKLSDADVHALREYIRFADGKAHRPAPAHSMPVSAAVGTAPVAMVAASASSGTIQAPGTVKQTRTNRPWNRDFARSWTIKGRRGDEVVTLQQFAISANENSEPECVPSCALSDYSVKVTSFDVAGRTLRLELTWSWKLNPKYWKIETFDLRLSDDGKKLNGTHALRTSGGHGADMIVWAE
jgi:hypothetical protein